LRQVCATRIGDAPNAVGRRVHEPSANQRVSDPCHDVAPLGFVSIREVNAVFVWNAIGEALAKAISNRFGGSLAPRQITQYPQ